jgi:predicted esterase
VGLVPTEGQRSRGFELEVAVHPSDLGRIVGIYPGAGGNIDGHKGKYAKLAEHIRTNGIGAVVRCGNPIPEDHGLDVNLRAMLDYCMANAREICGREEPEIYLMGFSAGAGACAAVARDYPQISRMLLLAPAEDVGREAIDNGLGSFGGWVYIFIGSHDEVVGSVSGRRFYDRAVSASHRELYEIPGCDHQFSSRANGIFLSKIPIYAFWQGERLTGFSCVPSIELY